MREVKYSVFLYLVLRLLCYYAASGSLCVLTFVRIELNFQSKILYDCTTWFLLATQNVSRQLWIVEMLTYRRKKKLCNNNAQGGCGFDTLRRPCPTSKVGHSLLTLLYCLSAVLAAVPPSARVSLDIRPGFVPPAVGVLSMADFGGLLI